MPTAPLPTTARRLTGWCFTLNNYASHELEAIKAIDCKYLVIGFEVGECGTPHLQGYIHFKTNQRFAYVKRVLGSRCHIEPAMGTVLQNFEYCTKDGNFWEKGERPLTKGEASKKAWANILEHAKSGDHEWLENNYPRVWVQLSHKLQSLQQPETTILDGELEHEWWVGPTGTGKSRTLWELYPKHFQKDTNKWWCGYRYQPVVAIEEWSPKNECTGSFLKIWADRYPFTGQIKGGSLERIRPQKLIILSNYEIHDCFPDTRDSHPLLRRFKVLRFPEDIELARTRAVQHHSSLVSSTIAEPPSDVGLPDLEDLLVSSQSSSDAEPPIDLSFLDDAEYQPPRQTTAHFDLQYHSFRVN